MKFLTPLLIVAATTLTGCGNDEKTYDAGYSDGQPEVTVLKEQVRQELNMLPNK